MTIVEFIAARLAEKETAALAATPGPWRHNPNRHWHRPGTAGFEESVFAGPAGAVATSVAGTGPSDDPQSMSDAHHIALHDPARVLREVAAKRAILALHLPMARRSTGADGGMVQDCQRCDQFPAQYPCDTVRALAAVHADHHLVA